MRRKGKEEEGRKYVSGDAEKTIRRALLDGKGAAMKPNHSRSYPVYVATLKYVEATSIRKWRLQNIAANI